MKTAIFAITEKGANIAKKIKDNLEDVDLYNLSDGSINVGLLDLVKKVFNKYEALIFVSATGIAVRAIAKNIKNKTVDPAVVVVDDMATFSISLLSGHLGGANDLAQKIADIVGAMPVITTATDIAGLPAIDLFMKDLGLKTNELEKLRKVSAGILRGESACIFADIMLGKWGDRIKAAYSIRPLQHLKKYENNYDHVVIVEDDLPVVVSSRDDALILKTRQIYAGVGCRKGVSFEEVKDAIKMTLAENGLHVHNLKGLATIDVKKEEAALRETADYFKVDLRYYSADELDIVAPSKSEFVKDKVGANGVCEPAAILASNNGVLIAPKKVFGNVTVALAEKE